MLKLGRVIPLSSSEANASTGFGRPGIDFRTIAWRKNVVEWADFILPLLKAPDKFAALTYFYITVGSPHDPWGMFNGMSREAEPDASFSAHDPKMFAGKPGRPKGPQPIYYFFKLLRNLRGTLLPIDSPDASRWNVVASRQGRAVNVVVQNKTAHHARLVLPLRLPAGAKIESVKLETLEYDPESPIWHIDKTDAGVTVDGVIYSGDKKTLDFSTATMQAAVGLELTRDLSRSVTDKPNSTNRDGLLSATWSGLSASTPTHAEKSAG